MSSFDAPDRKFLIAYRDSEIRIEAGDIYGRIQGDYDQPYVWVLSDNPPEERNARLWKVLYARTRYVYEFCSMDDDYYCLYERATIRSLLHDKGIPQSGDTLIHDHEGPCRILLQTDTPLRGWDPEKLLLNGLNRHELQMYTHVVDVAQPLLQTTH